MRDIALILFGAVTALVLTGLLHPLSTWLERLSRRLWRTRPLYVHVECDPAIIWAGEPPWVGAAVWLPELPRETPPEACPDWTSWARGLGGADAYQSTIKVTLQARADISLVIDRVRVHRESSQAPAELGGQVLSCRVSGAEPSPRRMEVNLDWGGSSGVVTWHDGDEFLTEPPQLALGPGEIEQFHIWATTGWGRQEWWLELVLLVDGRRIVVPVRDENDRPFATVGGHGLPEFEWSEDGWTVCADTEPTGVDNGS